MTEAAHFFAWLTGVGMALWVGSCFARAVWDEWRWRRTRAHPHTRAMQALRDMTPDGSCGAWCPARGCGGRCSQSPYHLCVECDAQVCSREWL